MQSRRFFIDRGGGAEKMAADTSPLIQIHSVKVSAKGFVAKGGNFSRGKINYPLIPFCEVREKEN